MIRELTKEDRDETVALLSRSKEYNLYALGNLNSVGFDEPKLSQFWGDFDNEGQLRGIINRYMNGWVVYGNSDADWAGLGAILDEHPVSAERLQDNPGGIESLVPFLQNYCVSQSSIQNFMALNAGDFVPTLTNENTHVYRASEADIPRLVRFYADAGHMKRSAKGVSRPVHDTRLWFAEQNGEICSAALTNAETDEVAMIGGVYTPERFRNRGFSSAVCSRLCADILENGKRPVLYWETPAAGIVYKRLGFHKIGDWRALRLQPIVIE